MDEACESAFLHEGILPTANPHDYHCYICDKDIKGIKCGIQHLQGRPHISALKKFEESYEKCNGLVICKICKFEGSWPMYTMHKSFHNSSIEKNSNSTSMSNHNTNFNDIIGNKKPQDLYEMFALHFISKHQQQFYCHLCYCILPSWFHAYQHIESELHKKSLVGVVTTFLPGNDTTELNILKVRARELIENCIFLQKPHEYNCFTCCKLVSGLHNLTQHIHGSNHRKCKATVKFIDKETGQIPQKTQVVANNVKMDNKTQLKIPDRLKSMVTAHGIRVMETEFYCPACNVVMNNNSAIESHLTSHLKMVWPNFKSSLDSQPNQPNSKITNQSENENSIPHICNLCDVKVPYEKILIQHYLGKKHRKYMVELFGTIESINKVKTDDETEENVNAIENVSYFCPGCDLKVHKVEALLNVNHNSQKQVGHTWVVIPGKKAIANPAAKDVQSAAGSFETDLRTLTEELVSIQSNKTRKGRKPKKCNSVDDVASVSIADKNSSPKDFVFTKDYIFDVDKKKLQKLKLSLKLSYVMDSEKMYCLICEVEVSSKLQNYYEHICSIDHMKNLAQMEKDDKEFEDYTDQFSDLSLAKEFVQELNDAMVKCFACNVEIVNEDHKIFDHIALESHDLKRQEWNAVSDIICEDILSETKNLWYNVVDYECKLCNFKYNSEVDFGKHLDEKIHSQRSLSYLMTRQGELMYDSCIPCSLLWFGNTLSYADHCKERTHKYKVKNNKYIIKELPESVKYMLTNFDDTINDLDKLSNEIRIFEEKKEKVLLKDLERSVQSQISKAKAYIFGSRAANLYSLKSNVDVYIDCGDMFYGQNCFNAQLQSVMKTLEQCLSSKDEAWLIESIVETTNPPYFKLEHKPTTLKCNLTFASGHSVVSTYFIKTFNNKYPTCKKLIIFLKEWLSACDLLGSSFISSYMITWLLIFYLQNKLIFPSIACLIEMDNASTLIKGWETGVSCDFSINPSKLSAREILIDFFKFYADLDYRNQVICPLLGTVIEKRTFTNPSNLPIQMKAYIDDIKAKNIPYFRTDVPMCIQDPFLLSDNIAVKTKKLTLNRFRQLCTKSAIFSKSS
ncbi:uncharacterized protein LOC107270835 isoform X2 [Cephus cinctus]|nr:uncharacterized protein LOC107270835 isoform X2 [Cephus cinctus]XP_015601691.1 uncharacterized protein LOC107270835 isoform X2 [Cephus cinctus]XP_015601692.1 uncharacterized protein LOC107270835 isoform X2 [Cephus cinctus]